MIWFKLAVFFLTCFDLSSNSWAFRADLSTTDAVIQKWAERKYENSPDCKYESFIQEATRSTQAIASQIYKKGSANYNLKNWAEVLRVCNSNSDSTKCFIDTDWVLHQEMEKVARKHGCQPQNIRNYLMESTCRPGYFKHTSTAFGGQTIHLCSLETKCSRTALYEEDSYIVKCKVSTSSCSSTSLANCDIFRFEASGILRNKLVPSMTIESHQGSQ